MPGDWGWRPGDWGSDQTCLGLAASGPVSRFESLDKTPADSRASYPVSRLSPLIRIVLVKTMLIRCHGLNRPVIRLFRLMAGRLGCYSLKGVESYRQTVIATDGRSIGVVQLTRVTV